MTTALKTAFDGAAARVCEAPELGRLTIAVRCDLVDTTTIAVRAGDHLAMVDEPKAFGGGGSAPSPGQLALAALGSCIALTYRLWAARLELDIDVSESTSRRTSTPVAS